MRRTFVVATAAAAAGAALTGLLAVGAPALAAGPGPGVGSGRAAITCPYRTADSAVTDRGPGMWGGAGDGSARGTGMGYRPGSGTARGMGMGMRWGTSTDTLLAGTAQGSITTAQRTSLAGMAEEEKLAHDVYVALAGTANDGRFARIATAESHHLDLVRALLSRYGVADPTSGKAAGRFADPAVQKKYDAFVARGSVSPDAALAVGRDIEKGDLAELASARDGVTADDVLGVYDRLAAASQNHLQAFGG